MARHSSHKGGLAAGSAALLLLASAPAGAAGLCQQSECAPDVTVSSGAIHRVCMPEPGCWNGDLVVYAHGYVAFDAEIAIPEDQLELPDGTSLPGLVNSLGFGFATTSYPENGLAIQPAIPDLVELVDTFTSMGGPPSRVYLTGVSEGGAVTALAVERYPEVFSGGLAACGPIGDFRAQLQYWGDFRTVFNYFFPGLVPGDASSVPDDVIESWETQYVPLVQAAIQANPSTVDELLAVTKAPVDATDPSTRERTILDLLWYGVFATNDGIEKLGGQPFDNRLRWYTGSSNDLRLNLRVKRFRADPAALLEIAGNYETTGQIALPVVTLHTTGDPIIPYWHEVRYRIKTFLSGAGLLHNSLPVFRYGHCEFDEREVLTAFGLLVLKVRGQEPAGLQELLARSR